MFGLLHWGMSIGVVAALPTSLLIGIGSVFWGKAVLDTRGLSWVVFAHALVDVAIMCAYVPPRACARHLDTLPRPPREASRDHLAASPIQVAKPFALSQKGQSFVNLGAFIRADQAKIAHFSPSAACTQGNAR
jgi:hypothetical protein